MSAKNGGVLNQEVRIIDGHTPQVSLFDTLPTNTAVQNVEWLDYQPLCLNDGQACQAIEFRVPGTGAYYFDLMQTRLNVRFKIVQKDGKDLPAQAKVGPVNLMHSSLFANIEAYFQQQPATKLSPPQYSYKAYFDTLLGYGVDAKNSFLQAQMWYQDTDDRFDEPDPYPNPADEDAKVNYGLVTRADCTALSKEVEVEGPIHADLFEQIRYMVNGIPLHVKCWPTSDEFRLMTPGDEGYRVIILGATLKMCSITITPEVMLAHNEFLHKVPAQLYFRQSDYKVFSLASGLFNFTADNLYQGAVPSKVLISLVASEAYNGAYKRNPFYFQHCHLTDLDFSINGVSVPGRPIRMDFDKNQILAGFLTLFTGTGFYGHNKSHGLTLESYKKGNTMYLIDTDSQHTTEYLPLPKQGNTRITVRFSKPLPEAMNLIMYGRFPTLMKIDAARNVVI